MAVFRVYVEKRSGFDVEAQALKSDLCTTLGLSGLQSVRIINRYDVEGLSADEFQLAVSHVFSEPQVDAVSFDPPSASGAKRFVCEYLPGQFDQRADSAAQCISLITAKERPLVRSAKLYLFTGEISDDAFARIKAHIINPIESREAQEEVYETLRQEYPVPADVAILTGFCSMEEAQLPDFCRDYGLAMDVDDLRMVRDYFRSENRDPSLTELRVIDTYWSDHCRHTTFSTILDDISIESPEIRSGFEEYLSLRSEVYPQGDRPVTLMDVATIGAKALRRRGMLPRLDESEEINACSVKIDVDVDGKNEDWLLLFKNETHNHPTEIEPFGGAATCLGGAIRDPLSGRSYVYQAMRVTGAADPLAPLSETLPGKLPQRKITQTAAAGYSSYGNQIGIATGLVDEIYHPGYVAKRLEIGAVVGAVKASDVRRESPQKGDRVILCGGRTGRDGCGGATGSSKSHSADSLSTCGAEVQKGNPPEERKLQRLLRNPEASRLIKRCNDFGAGGVCVAIGELADSLHINLDAVRKKYDGLDATELAISESQERMAMVVSCEDAKKLIALAEAENLEAYEVAEVTDDGYLTMEWRGKEVLRLARSFLNTNGAKKHICAVIDAPVFPAAVPPSSFGACLTRLVEDLNICSKKGLVERFDSSIGAGSVLLPHGGKRAMTPAQVMAAKIPLRHGETTTCSVMGYGFNPYISEISPYHGAVLAVVESLAKLTAAGACYRDAYLSFQEYFKRLRTDPKRWGSPLSALLGALHAQMGMGIAAIGGKDSMSGSFEDIDVPPTFVSFAIAPAKTGNIISPEFKKAGNKVYLIAPERTDEIIPDFNSTKEKFDAVTQGIRSGKIVSAWAVTTGGVCEGIFKMCLGNRLGFCFDPHFPLSRIDLPAPGSILVEVSKETEIEGIPVGSVQEEYCISFGGETIPLDEPEKRWLNRLEPVFPLNTADKVPAPHPITSQTLQRVHYSGARVPSPRVLIPVFPGTNCEYDTARAFEAAGAQTEIFVIKNQSAADIEASAQLFGNSIQKSNIIAIPGGFSGGDEPDGSGKFIAAFFRNPRIREEITRLLEQRDGLMLGICNGFQALIKLGLVPFGRIIDPDEDCPTLTYNRIGRHQAMNVRIRVCSTKSPWYMHCCPGDIHSVAISHGEGRFVASDAWIKRLIDGGQVATQYVDPCGNPSMDIRFNPNGSVSAIEGITSPDGRILGKMGHTERYAPGVFQNLPGNYDQSIFRGAVDYFRG